MNLKIYINKLIVSLKQNNQVASHKEFNPIEARKIFDNLPKYSNSTKISAVTIVLFNIKNVTYSLLIERSKYNGAHSGQIALPGGKYDTEDKSVVNTAIRELKEETGIVISENDIIGELESLFIPVSNFMVFPFVAFIDKPNIEIDKYEVADYFIYPISELLSPESLTNMELTIQDNKINVPAFKIQNHEVWGATSMILNDFKSRVLKTLNE